MSGADKKRRRAVMRAFDITFEKAFQSLRKQINAYPFRNRLKIAWLVLWGKF